VLIQVILPVSPGKVEVHEIRDRDKIERLVTTRTKTRETNHIQIPFSSCVNDVMDVSQVKKRIVAKASQRIIGHVEAYCS
jgi:hypothetical protein